MYTPAQASFHRSISENLWAMDNLKSELEVHQCQGHSSLVSQIAIIFMIYETVTATATVKLIKRLMSGEQHKPST